MPLLRKAPKRASGRKATTKPIVRNKKKVTPIKSRTKGSQADAKWRRATREA